MSQARHLGCTQAKGLVVSLRRLCHWTGSEHADHCMNFVGNIDMYVFVCAQESHADYCMSAQCRAPLHGRECVRGTLLSVCQQSLVRLPALAAVMQQGFSS